MLVFASRKPSTGGVSSFNGRTGAVVPAGGDYSVGQVTGAAPLASPAFTGTPTVPEAPDLDNTTKAASTSWVNRAISEAPSGALTSIGGHLGGAVNLGAGADTTVFSPNFPVPGTWLLHVSIDLDAPASDVGEYDLLTLNNGSGDIASWLGVRSATFINELATEARQQIALTTILVIDSAGTINVTINNTTSANATARANNSIGSPANFPTSGWSAVKIA